MKKQKTGKDFRTYLNKLVKKSDYFKISFNFQVKKDETYQTFFGGICFIIFFISCLTYSVKLFTDFISEHNMNIIYYTKYDLNNEIDMSDENLFYSILITNENDTNVFNMEYSNMFVIQQKFVLKESGNITKIDLDSSKCDLKKHKMSYLLKQLKGLHISDFLCFTVPNETLKGTYTSSTFSYIDISIMINETTYKNNPKAYKEIMNRENFKITYYYNYNEIFFDSGKVEEILNSIYSYLDLRYMEYINVFYTSILFEEDKNIFYSSYKRNYLNQYSYYDNKLKYINEFDSGERSSNILTKFYLRNNLYQEVILVIFNKLPEFLSNIVALAKTIYMLIGFIVSNWNLFKAKQSIFSRTYKFKDLYYTNFLSYKNHCKFEDELVSKDKLEKKSKLINNQKVSDNTERNMIEGSSNCIDNNSNLYLNDNNNYNNSDIKKIQILSEGEKLKNSINQNKNQDQRNYNFLDKHEINNDEYNSVFGVSILKKKGIFYRLKDDEKNILSSLKKESNYKLHKLNNLEKPNNINPFKIRINDLISKYICKDDKKYKRKITPYIQAEKNFNYNLDIISYMKRCNEIQILKKILFGSDFKTLFEYIARPIFSFYPDKNSIDFFENDIYKILMGKKLSSDNHKINSDIFDELQRVCRTKENSSDNEHTSINSELKKQIKNYLDLQNEYLFDF